MQRPRREEFILDVRRSVRTLQNPSVETDADGVDTDAIAKILHRAAVWLTPKVVEHYHPDDFAAWQQDQQDRLRVAVDEFRSVAGQVPPDRPATIDQFTEGTHRFRDMANVLGEMIRAEWLHAIDTVEKQAEEWSAAPGWRSRRVIKKVTESLIGTYDAPQLLIFAAPNLYVLDPVARFVPGAQGSFDLTIQPSYHASSLYRADNGSWYVHLEVRNGISQGKPVPWSKDAFHECIEQLRVLV